MTNTYARVSTSIGFARRAVEAVKRLRVIGKRHGGPTKSAEREAYYRALRDRALGCMETGTRLALQRDVCAAYILACIARGHNTRDDLVRSARAASKLSFRAVGFALGHFEGTDPEKHLWTRGTDKRYSALIDTKTVFALPELRVRRMGGSAAWRRAGIANTQGATINRRVDVMTPGHRGEFNDGNARSTIRSE